MTRPLTWQAQLVKELRGRGFDITDDTVKRVFNEYRSLDLTPNRDQLVKRLGQVHWHVDDPFDGLDDLIEQVT
jgi:arginine repressor